VSFSGSISVFPEGVPGYPTWSGRRERRRPCASGPVSFSGSISVFPEGVPGYPTWSGGRERGRRRESAAASPEARSGASGAFAPGASAPRAPHVPQGNAATDSRVSAGNQDLSLETAQLAAGATGSGRAPFRGHRAVSLSGSNSVFRRVCPGTPTSSGLCERRGESRGPKWREWSLRARASAPRAPRAMQRTTLPERR
jgi:hypothetical protein